MSKSEIDCLEWLSTLIIQKNLKTKYLQRVIAHYNPYRVVGPYGGKTTNTNIIWQRKLLLISSLLK